jgi:hypothetical protein
MPAPAAVLALSFPRTLSRPFHGCFGPWFISPILPICPMRPFLFCISMVERVNEPAQYEAMSFAE